MPFIFPFIQYFEGNIQEIGRIWIICLSSQALVSLSFSNISDIVVVENNAI